MEQDDISHGNNVARHDAPERDTARHTLTVRQAADLFAQLGSPRSPRSVQRFCEQKLLDAIAVTRDNGTTRYFIDPQSVERYAAELKQLQEISQLGMDMARHDVPERDMARHDAPRIEKPEAEASSSEGDLERLRLREKVGVLEKENLHLRIDNAARVMVINQMADERHGFIEQLTSQSREIGRLEVRVELLGTPNADVTRHDASDTAESDAVLVQEKGSTAINVEPVAAPAPIAPEPRPSFLRRVFGGK